MPEIYICTSVEVDGPIPGPHSLRSLASAAYDADHVLLSTHSVNLAPLPDAHPHPDFLARWRSIPNAWAVVTHDPQPPAHATLDYLSWLDHLPARKVLVAYPSAVPFLFLEWYLFHFADRSPFRRGALDLRTYAMALLHRRYHRTLKKNMPPAWLEGHPPRTHVALDDALAVGGLWQAVTRARAALPKIEGPDDEALPGLVDP